MKKQKTFKGVDIEYSADAFICPECGLEAGTVQSAGDVQRAIADVYRKRIGLLTGQEISLPRIKLVAETFERTLRKRLLKSGDKLLFLA